VLQWQRWTRQRVLITLKLNFYDGLIVGLLFLNWFPMAGMNLSQTYLQWQSWTRQRVLIRLKLNFYDGLIVGLLFLNWSKWCWHTSLSTIPREFAPGFINYKKGAVDSQPQEIKFSRCFPMVGSSLRVLWLLPPLKQVAMI
jgi:hypothetical protein